MTDRPAAAVPAPAVLARLAGSVPGVDQITRTLYWRGGGRPDGAGGLVLDAGETVDLGTWFNAAPVGWWRAVLGIDRVRLRAAGSGELTVFRAGRAAAERIADGRIDGGLSMEFAVGDATWIWVTVHAAGGPARLESVSWEAVSTQAGSTQAGSTQAGSAQVGSAQAASTQLGALSPPVDRRSAPESSSVQAPAGLRATVVVPTYGRERDALDQVRRLLAPELADVVARVVLVDQARTVRADPGAAEAMSAAGDRLLLLEQDNLGGSGGYARGMLESLRFPHDAVLLLDDDARIDPDGLRRMLTVSALAVAAGRPTILGTPLFSAEQPVHLEALAEGVRRRGFRWGPTDRIGDGVDVSVTDPSGWSFADPAAPTDYTGWWGTLLPPGAVAELGLPAPFFLKWDDAEYGLRAVRAGYRVATLPGTGVWHPTWAAKGTISSWAAWPLHRNRLAAAAAYRAGRGVLLDSLMHQVKHVLSLQYQTAELWDAALAQFVAGPEWLAGSLRTTRDRAQGLLDEEESKRRPVAGAAAVTGPSATTDSPVGRAVIAARAARAVAGLVRHNRMAHTVRTAPAAFSWRTGIGRDAVLLTGSDRSLVRDPVRARAALARTVRLHLRVAIRWNSLCRRYAVALPESRTEGRWRTVIGTDGRSGGLSAR